MKRFSNLFWISTMVMLFGIRSVQAEKPYVGCEINVNGTSNGSVDRYSSATFTLNGSNCNGFAATWTFTCSQSNCGQIIGTPGADGFEYFFSDPDITSGVVKAFNTGGDLIASKSITIVPHAALTGGTISNPSQQINYGASNAEIVCSASSNGTGTYSYLWFYSTDNSTFYTTGVTSQNYPASNLTTTTYFKRNVSSGYQSKVSTNIAVVNVYPQLFSGTAAPSSQSINYNTSPSQLSVSSPSGGSGTYSYQWQSSATSSGSFTDISGATSTTYSPGNLTSTRYYRVAINSNGAIVYSNVIGVTVYSTVSAGSVDPSSVTLAYGKSTSVEAISVSGGNGSYTYQWQKASNIGGPWNNIAGATNSVLATGFLYATTYYRCVVTSNGVSATGSSGVVNVEAQILVGENSPAAQTILINTAPTMYNDNIVGGNGTYTYKWQTSDDNVTWPTLGSGASTSTPAYTPSSTPSSTSPISSTKYYRLVVTSGGGNDVSPSSVVYVMNTGTAGPTKGVNYGTSPGQLSLTGVSGGNGTNTYQWQSSSTSSFTSPSNISGATSTTYTPPNLTATTYYRVAITNTGSTLYSGYATITVYPSVVAGTLAPATQAINYDELSGVMTVSGYSGGNGTYNFQWQASSTLNGTYENVSVVLSTPSFREDTGLKATKYYRAIVKSNGASATTNSILVTVHPELKPGTIDPSSVFIYSGSSPGDLESKDVEGGFGGYSYQWERSTQSNFLPRTLVGTNSWKYAPPALTETSYYRVIVTSNGVSKPSASSLITVYPTLVPGTVSPANQSVNYEGSSLPLTLAGTTGGNTSYTYQWQSSPNSAFTNPTNVGNGTTTYTPSNIASSYYRVVVTSFGMTLTTAPVRVTVYPRLNAGSIIPDVTYITAGSPAPGLLNDGLTGGAQDKQYLLRWETSTDKVNWTLVSNVFTLFYQPPGYFYSTRYYRMKVTNNGDTKWTDPAVIIVYNSMKPGVITTPTLIIDPGMETDTLRATAATEGACGGSYEYEWEKSTNGITYTATGVTTKNYWPGIVNVTTWYRRKVTCGPETLYTNVTKVVIESLSADISYLRTRVITRDNVKTRSSADALTDVAEVQQTTQYYDGIGRPMQTVQRKASPEFTDVVNLQTYDQFGRESKQFLPYASTSQTGNIKLTPLSDQQDFNSDKFPGEQYYAGETAVEPSPLGRTVGTYAPGKSWVGVQRGTTSQYLLNIVSDSVRQWNVVADGSAPVSTQNYPAGMLTKTITTNEELRQIIEFKDKEGQVILKKVQAVNAPGTGHTGWACTYYVYDDNNNLVFVLPPEAVRILLTDN